VPIRIGVNFGSVARCPASSLTRWPSRARRKLNCGPSGSSARRWDTSGILEDLDFGMTKVSLKAFELPVLFEAYRALPRCRTTTPSTSA
jgi:(E)-4-hydroxy-3-methylbut-2-enyl-diphosphate synthase